jgi:hypothetical protein
LALNSALKSTDNNSIINHKLTNNYHSNHSLNTTNGDTSSFFNNNNNNNKNFQYQYQSKNGKSKKHKMYNSTSFLNPHSFYYIDDNYKFSRKNANSNNNNNNNGSTTQASFESNLTTLNHRATKLLTKNTLTDTNKVTLPNLPSTVKHLEGKFFQYLINFSFRL